MKFSKGWVGRASVAAWLKEESISLAFDGDPESLAVLGSFRAGLLFIVVTRWAKAYRGQCCHLANYV